MFFKKRYSFDKNIDKSVVLCQSYIRAMEYKITNALSENNIPFRKDRVQIPFFLRKKFRGANEICIFSVNRTDFSKAKFILPNMTVRELRKVAITPSIAI